MVYVYVLYSMGFDRYYIGSSADPDQRLRSHNSGKVRSTKKHAPWTRVHLEGCEDRSRAMQREKYLKSGYGRRWLKQHITRDGGVAERSGLATCIRTADDVVAFGPEARHAKNR